MLKPRQKPVVKKAPRVLPAHVNTTIKLLIPVGLAWLGYRTEVLKSHADTQIVVQDTVFHRDSTYKTLNTIRWKHQEEHNNFSDSLALSNSLKLDSLLHKK